MTEDTTYLDDSNTKKVDAITKKAKIAWATQVFERIKNGDKVAASDLERASCILSESTHSKSAGLGLWASNQVELADVLGVERKTIQRWLKINGCPQARSDGRFNVQEFREWASKTGRKISEDDPMEERNKLEVRRLRTICERLDLELAVAKETYTANDEVTKGIYRMIGSARKVLSAMPAQLAPQVVGMSIPDAEQRIREHVDSAMKHLHEGNWE